MTADPHGPARTIAVLRCLAAHAAPVPAATVVREVGCPRASAYRILTSLAATGFATHYPESRTWGLGVGAFEIGTAYLRQGALERLARPTLTRLARTLGVSAHFAVLQGTDILYVVKESAPRAARLVTDVGVRLPASHTASGRAVLGALPTVQVRALYPPGTTLTPRTDAGPTSVVALRALLVRESERGWSFEDGEVTTGLASVAAAVIGGDGWPSGAVAVTFERERWPVPTEPATAVVAAAGRLSHRLRAGA